MSPANQRLPWARARSTPKGPRNFLVDLDHANILFRLVIGIGNAKVPHEVENGRLVAGHSDSATPPMLRWAKRSGLVDWLLSATDAGLDVVEDVVRHLSSK